MEKTYPNEAYGQHRPIQTSTPYLIDQTLKKLSGKRAAIPENQDHLPNHAHLSTVTAEQPITSLKRYTRVVVTEFWHGLIDYNYLSLNHQLNQGYSRIMITVTEK